MTTEVTKANGGSDKGMIAREEFGSKQLQTNAETAMAAVTARERAMVEAQYVMAERHPRNWDTVRVRLLSHCQRTGFAEAGKYKKPTGKKKINGEWKDTFAEGLSVRFAETARQEMGNIKTDTAVIYEDDLIRIVKAFVIDLERNNIESREVTVAKVTEKRGRKERSSDKWDPPEGREVISQRLNTYGEPVFLCKATDDETRNKLNAEISKIQRDGTLRLIPSDIKEEAYAFIIQTLSDPQKTDPTAARKRVIDSFASLGVMPEDLATFAGVSLDRLSPFQVDELRSLYTGIKDGETSFDQALRAKYDVFKVEDGEETGQQHDARLQRQMRSQEEVAKERIEKLKADARPDPSDAAEMTEEEMRAEQAAAAEGTPKPAAAAPRKRGF